MSFKQWWYSYWCNSKSKVKTVKVLDGDDDEQMLLIIQYEIMICFKNSKNKGLISTVLSILGFGASPIFLQTNQHLQGDVVNIPLAAFTIPESFPGPQFKLGWSMSPGQIFLKIHLDVNSTTTGAPNFRKTKL